MPPKAAPKVAKRPAKQPAQDVALVDKGEDPIRMEPMRLPEDCKDRNKLTDLVLELTKRSTSFRSNLPKGLTEPLCDFVRSMNCYYSNFIEDRATHPVNIERALHNDFSANPEKRNLQLEAKAHIETQRWIDSGGLDEKPNAELTQDGLKAIHKKFTGLLPDELRWVHDPEDVEKRAVVPGEYRDHFVKVGYHVAPSPGSLLRFMSRFEARYNSLGQFDAILNVAAAHHRFVYIHPFADGNGRVARLMSYATLRRTLDTAGLWSVARGLARKQSVYKELLAENDRLKDGDLDGRGTLSESSLVKLTEFFLTTCVDQVDYMEELMQPNAFRGRIMTWAEEQVGYGTLPKRAPRVLDALLFRGSLTRAEVSEAIDQSERTASNVTQALLKQGIVTSSSSRAPLYIAFPAKLAPRLMPGLFPETMPE